MKAKSKNSIGGASKFIRKQIAKGVAPAEVKRAAINLWPKLGTKFERPYLTKRIQIAKRVAAHQHAGN